MADLDVGVPERMSRDGTPAQPTWRRKPSRRRAKARKMQTSTAKIGSKSGQRATTPVKRKTGLRLPDQAAVKCWAQYSLLIALTAGVACGLAMLLQLPVWQVSRTSTQVGGNRRLTSDKVLLAAGVEGRSIFLLRQDDIEAAVRELPGIADARVHLRLPNQVVIDVWEYAPLVAWRTITTTVWLTAEGTVVPQTGEAPPLTLNDRSASFPETGNPMTEMLLRNLRTLSETLPEVREVDYTREHGLTFRTREGWEVWLGEGGSLREKLQLLAAAREEISRLGRQIQVIDLRHSSRQAIWW